MSERCGCGGLGAELDVRPLAPRDRHPAIFERLDGLAPGEAVVLVNDHDPRPLYYQLQAERPGAFRWRYLERGPEVWRVEIARLGPTAPPAAPEPMPAVLAALPPAARVDLDVRPDLARGEEPFRRIMDTVGRLGPGQVLVLRAPFEPVPLYRVMERRGFAHWTECRAPDDWSVWFYRAATEEAPPPC